MDVKRRCKEGSSMTPGVSPMKIIGVNNFLELVIIEVCSSSPIIVTVHFRNYRHQHTHETDLGTCQGPNGKTLF